MELPKATENIFPYSEENLKALLDHYFPGVSDEDIIRSFNFWFNEERELKFSLNQLESGARFCRENQTLLDVMGFSYIPAVRIFYVLMSLSLPAEEWGPFTSKSHRKRLKDFKIMFQYHRSLFKEIDSVGFQDFTNEKTQTNLEAVLDQFFPDVSPEARKISMLHFSKSRESMGYISFGAQFCGENKDFLDDTGVSQIPSERIHEVLSAIFYPGYRLLYGEYEIRGERYKLLKNKYLAYILEM